ncbi:hypothetical protein BD410DRAFT_842059 [Rickenella mellea]|uniref:Crinkler effector protein N-terminal domain-containing protein n=1 Tax=Rickenella mellea TaxID=50990 RepID=A0A4Y7PXA1_9AGAM|nr:hypothetical protein BD410DRAFT_842059 [Rickenella mellea]
MADVIKLWYLIQGDTQPFLLPVSADKRIVNLRKGIWERGKNSILGGINAKDLVLWKVDEEIMVEPAAGLAKRVADCPPKQSKLESGHDVSTHFPAPVNENILHIFVERPILEQRQREYSDPEPDINPIWSRREQTVGRLFERLQSQGLVYIRGTPASGKSTLLKLVHEHIRRRRPEAIVRIVKAWPQGTFHEWGNPIDRFRRLIPGYPFSNPRNTYILFDNGHQTYWDGGLWEYFIKDQVQSGFLYRAVLFCGYGNPSNRPVWYSGGAPPVIGPWSRVSLRRQNERGGDDDEEGVGLLLSRPEFDEYMANLKYFPLDSRFRDMVYEWTTGHAGAIDAIWQIIKSEKQNGSLEAYTVEDFYQLNPWEAFFTKLGRADFVCGLPTKIEMQNPNVANVMRKLLKNWTIGTGETEEEKEAVRTCHENGWIQADLIKASLFDEKIVYSFASPLHRVYISQQFTLPDAQTPHKTVADLTFDIIQRFKPVQLSGSTLDGTLLTPRPIEARYRDEFYRRLGELVGDCVRISPEFLTGANAKKGCIDFFLPTQRWGISITYEGNGLQGRCERVGLHSAYGAWLTSSNMIDWIILNCCREVPEDPHEDVSNLFHAVFTEDCTEVIILDNKLKELKEFALVEVTL